MKKSIHRKLKQIANEQVKFMFQSEKDILEQRYMVIKMLKPRFIPRILWNWIVDKVTKR